MKKGRELTEVLAEVERMSALKEDFLVNTGRLQFDHIGSGNGSGYRLGFDWRDAPKEPNAFGISDIAHGQIAEKMGIPVRYYSRMRQEAPSLLANNVNHWFQNEPCERMLRTLGGEARAFLSNRYRRLDNEDLATALLPALDQLPGIRVESCEITSTRLYIKAVTESLTGELAVGDIVNGGVVISNSEVGWGALKIEPMVFRLICLNGMIVPDYGLRKYHIGRTQESDALFACLSDEAIEADDHAFWLKARDVLKAALSEDVFGKIVARMRDAGEEKVTGDPFEVIERLAKRSLFNAGEQKSILQHLLAHEELTRLGVSNAITRAAQEVESYDRATDLEYAGAEVLWLPKGEWKEIAEAA